MELTKKQIILIAAISGAILLFTIGAIVLCSSDDADETTADPTAVPMETILPTATATTTASPLPTVFRLPLVPQWDTPMPGAAGSIGAFAPRFSAPPAAEPSADAGRPAETAAPWVGIDDERVTDILAVGLLEGRAAALLLLRFGEDTLTVVALPAETAEPVTGKTLTEQGEKAARLAGKLTGRRYERWMALDLSCLPAVLEVTGSLGEGSAVSLTGDGSKRAEEALVLMAGAVTYAQRMSLLRLPALKRAIGDAFESNLSARELWNLLWTVRGGIAVQRLLLPIAKMKQDR